MHITLRSETAQVAFGEALGQALQGRGRVYLEGELGAGKTTLVRGVLRAYGHHGAVKSPTYTLVEPYVLEQAGRELRINHFDLYRLGDPEELEFMGARDLLDEQQLCLIEWPSRGTGWLPEPDIHIQLTVCDEGREARLQGMSDDGRAALERLADNKTRTET
ncbi:tRNA (adenosine(37)-N6)-threonylcarbamoyltransferase complex ATPase subunit type 1 TsaE [Pistricoccus aurantiacus]|uniref:tRNA (adenosine(37)-N6)-threonylcarbamoyltransferase complex ATPase subunit type 1 TsaE n=1 Tax=Pistricoccus aurantiacus TaxID=1883414 RepID=UPI00362A603F